MLQRLLIALLAVSTALLVAGAGAAGEAHLAQRISIDLEGAAPADVFGSFAEAFGVELYLAPEVKKEITLRLENVKMRTALDAICDSIGCFWQLELLADSAGREGTYLTVRPVEEEPVDFTEIKTHLDQPVSLKLRDASVAEVLGSFARVLSAELEIQAGTVRGEEIAADARITIDVENEPLRQALDAICLDAGCSWSIVEEEGAVLRVTF